MPTITGSTGNDVLTGTSSMDTIHGLDGDDVIDGGFGADELYGDAGDDGFIFTGVGFTSPAPPVGLIDGGAGIDTIDARSITGTQLSYSGGGGLTFTAGNQSYAVADVETFRFGSGSDLVTLFYGAPLLTLYMGDGGDNITAGVPSIIFGEGGDDLVFSTGGVTADGGAGVDTFSSGGTVDLEAGTAFWYSSSAITNFENVSATVNYGESATVRGDANANRLAANHFLGEAGAVLFEGLAGNDILIGAGAGDTLRGGDDDDLLQGLGGDDLLYGDAGNDRLQGGDGLDQLIGGDGNDVLLGGAGNDNLIGGIGDDSFEVTEIGDIIVESAAEGNDTVFSYLSYELGDNLENLRLVGGALDGTGNSLANVLVGNNLSNTLIGSAGDDTMYGAGGDDSYEVTEAGDVVFEDAGNGFDTVYTYVDSYALSDNVESLRLVGSTQAGYGNALNNVLVGNAFNNTLIGGAGNDIMVGGAGDDSYEIAEEADSVVENAGEGIDTLFSYVNYSLGANVENLRLVGTALNAAGNTLDNIVVGNAMDNILIGGGGNDILIGSTGNDSYEVTEGEDLVYEASGEGIDTIYSYVDTYQLSDNVEQLRLVGGARLGLGSAGDNTLVGNDVNNILNGNGGNDVLTGSVGSDQFWHLAGDGNDTITDFTVSDSEVVVLSQSQFSNFAAVQSAMTQVGNNVVITSADAQTLTLNNVSIDQLGAGNFAFYTGAVSGLAEPEGKMASPFVMAHEDAGSFSQSYGPGDNGDAFILSSKDLGPLVSAWDHDMDEAQSIGSAGFAAQHDAAAPMPVDQAAFLPEDIGWSTQTHHDWY